MFPTPLPGQKADGETSAGLLPKKREKKRRIESYIHLPKQFFLDLPFRGWSQTTGLGRDTVAVRLFELFISYQKPMQK